LIFYSWQVLVTLICHEGTMAQNTGAISRCISYQLITN
jgi:hypothetical protein